MQHSLTVTVDRIPFTRDGVGVGGKRVGGKSLCFATFTRDGVGGKSTAHQSIAPLQLFAQGGRDALIFLDMRRIFSRPSFAVC